MPTIKATICKTEKEFIQKALQAITGTIQNSKKTYHIALSGGSTPGPIYKALASLAPPLPKSHFYQTDERYVPATHKDSNQKMIKESFGAVTAPNHATSTPATSHNFHFFDTSLSIPSSLKSYAKILPEKFDLTILGIGPDGHIASLFPHSKALTSKSKTASSTTKDFAIKDRLSLTFPQILASKKILVLLKGHEKAEILKKLQTPQNLTIQNFPAKKLLSHKNLQILFLEN